MQVWSFDFIRSPRPSHSAQDDKLKKKPRIPSGGRPRAPNHMSEKSESRRSKTMSFRNIPDRRPTRVGVWRVRSECACKVV